MSKARTLADFISDGSEFADGTISVSEVSGAAPLASPSFTGTPKSDTFFEIEGADNALLTLDETNGVAGGAQSTYISMQAAGAQTAYLGVASSGGIMYVANKYGPLQLMTGPSGTETSKLLLGDSGEAVFNEGGADYDFRVESDSRSNALVLDGSTGGLALNTTNTDFYTGYDTTSIKLGPVASMWSLSNGSSDRRMTIDQNLYVNTDGTNRYLTTGAAARYQMNTGTHRFETAPSGSDDATASDLAVQMLILNSGDVRMLGDNSNEQELNFRTTSSAGRSVKKSISRGDSGATNPMVEIQMDGYGTNNYLGQMKVLMTPSDTYNSGQIDVFKIQATGGATFNEDGVSYNDFRVESDTNTHMLFVDAGANHVNIGTSTDFGGTLNVAGVINQNRLAGITKFTDLSADLIHTGNYSATFTTGSGGTTQHSAVALWSDDHSSYSGQIHIVGNTSNGGSVNAAGEVEFWTFNGSSYTLEGYMGPRGYVFNEASRNVDFRVESNNQTHMLFVDAGSNSVGIKTSATDAALNVNSQSSTTEAIRITGSGGNPFIEMVGNQGQTAIRMWENGANDPGYTSWYNQGTEQHKIQSGANETVVFNEQGINTDFRIESNNNANMLKVDASADKVLMGTSSVAGVGDSQLQVAGLGIRGSMGVTTGTNTGIPINQGSSGGTALILASRNHNSGTGTQSQVAMIQFYYDGNYTPALTHISGSNFITVGKTGTSPNETLTLSNTAGGNCTVTIFMST
jgi:ribosomal protein L31